MSKLNHRTIASSQPCVLFLEGVEMIQAHTSTSYRLSRRHNKIDVAQVLEELELGLLDHRLLSRHCWKYKRAGPSPSDTCLPSPFFPCHRWQFDRRHSVRYRRLSRPPNRRHLERGHAPVRPTPEHRFYPRPWFSRLCVYSFFSTRSTLLSIS